MTPTRTERGWRLARIVARRVWRGVRWPIAAVLVILALLVQSAVVVVWALPFDPSVLRPTGGPLVIVDRRGTVLATVPNPGGQADRDHWVALGDIPAVAASAVIEAEDDGFWEHRGVDARGIARAAWLDLRAGRAAFGGSTLTMQLARMIDSQGEARSWTNKLSESLLALRIERAVDKRTILEQWMNRAYFGNGAYGIEAASELYFGKRAAALSTAEAVLLAVIPRAPAGYDPITHLDAALRRRDYVLELLVDRGVLTKTDAALAQAQPLSVSLHRPTTAAPHFVRWVLAQVPDEVKARGGVVHTTLDGELQAILERRLREHVAGLGEKNVQQAGLVVIDTKTSDVLAMVGSADWDGDAGEINITARRRNPGSALKPFVYAAAIEAGDSPATIAYDVRDASKDYFVPSGGVEHGPVRYREALASSYNFAAVGVLEKVGVPRVMTALRAAGVTDLPGAPDDYGLRLALGAAKVRLVDLAAGYGFLVRGGVVRRAQGVASVTGEDGATWRPARPMERRVFSPTTSWLVMDMLSDPEARRPAFGTELPLDLSFRVAAKTGTARGFSDTVAVAATDQVIVAAWAGNFDGSPSHGVVAMDASAPLVRDALLAIAQGHDLTLPVRPDDVEDVDVCAISGMKPGPHCPIKHEVVAKGRGPTKECDWHREIDGRVQVVYPAQAAGWERRRTRAARPVD
ncbi:MAG TPA: transglycosylase domain-containing protein [Kofleriaceae bacterium]|nr:transglycosylase domain-containing protein [Kofleriaceae bacterium]